MKRFILLLLFVFSLSVQRVHSQVMPVIDAAVADLMAATKIDQSLHYIQLAKDQVANLAKFTIMIENLGTQITMQLQNLQSASDIESFNDFMNWYNRSLYLDKQTVDTFKNMNITVGKKSYHFMDMESMAYGLKETYVDYWDKEFTEEQRREMWLNLGLTPANYAYVQPFRNEMNEWRKTGFAADHIQNKIYMDQMERNKKRQERLAKDKDLKTEDKMGEKEVLMLLLESSMDNNKVLNDMVMNQALEMKRKATEMYLEDMPDSEPALSEWRDDVFKPLRK
jgi:hypothetical protein